MNTPIAKAMTYAQCCIGLVFIAFTAFPALGANDDPPELVARRQDHLRAIQSVTTPVLQDYLRSLQVLKQQLNRDRNRVSDSVAVDAEIAAVTQQLQLATNRIVIISAVYGLPSENRVVDITKRVQDALAARQNVVKLEISGIAKGADPAPGRAKQTLIHYSVNGQAKKRTFPDGHELNFLKDLD